MFVVALGRHGLGSADPSVRRTAALTSVLQSAAPVGVLLQEALVVTQKALVPKSYRMRGSKTLSDQTSCECDRVRHATAAPTSQINVSNFLSAFIHVAPWLRSDLGPHVAVAGVL